MALNVKLQIITYKKTHNTNNFRLGITPFEWLKDGRRAEAERESVFTLLTRFI